jgi:hypothetical protein
MLLPKKGGSTAQNELRPSYLRHIMRMNISHCWSGDKGEMKIRYGEQKPINHCQPVACPFEMHEIEAIERLPGITQRAFRMIGHNVTKDGYVGNEGGTAIRTAKRSWDQNCSVLMA